MPPVLTPGTEWGAYGSRAGAGQRFIEGTLQGAMQRLRRGLVRNFDAATWKAVVAFDGAIGAVTLPVGQWVAELDMTDGAIVATLFFDDNNPDDGLVLGPYGALPASAAAGLTHPQVMARVSLRL